jgi:hypothetical protein
MALDDNDKNEILKLVTEAVHGLRGELERHAAVAPVPPLDIRSAKKALRPSSGGPVSSDKCCNGCD